jgi:DNA mismatch endonuclease (patch repair protein)
MDNVTRKKRSETMRAVKSKDSKIELLFRKEIWKRGGRYRKNQGLYFGKPDLINKSKKTVIFIDSCFWHGCPSHCRIPKTNKEYWVKKINRNKERDIEVNQYYKAKGWNILRVWEHDIKNTEKLKIAVENISNALR